MRIVYAGPDDAKVDASGFDVVEMHKNIGAAIIRQDEAKPAIYVERTSPGQLAFLVAFHPIAAPPGHAATPPSSVMNSRRVIGRCLPCFR